MSWARAGGGRAPRRSRARRLDLPAGRRGAGRRPPPAARRSARQRGLAGSGGVDVRRARPRAGGLRPRARAGGLDAARPLVRRLRGDAAPRRLPRQRVAADRLLHRRRRGAGAGRAGGDLRRPAGRGRGRLRARGAREQRRGGARGLGRPAPVLRAHAGGRRGGRGGVRRRRLPPPGDAARRARAASCTP